MSEKGLNEEELQFLLDTKFKLVQSERLDRKVYTLVEWVPKTVFKKHKKLFGYTDIGWTVKHPKKLCRALVADNVWSVDPVNISEYLKNRQPSEDNGQIAD